MADELLPCPFCGNSPPTVLREGNRRHSAQVSCDECGVVWEGPSTDGWNRRALLSQEAKPVAQPVALKNFIDAVTLHICELPDRDSPDDWPEAMLVTGDELAWIIEEHIGELSAAAPDEEAKRHLLSVADLAQAESVKWAGRANKGTPSFALEEFAKVVRALADRERG